MTKHNRHLRPGVYTVTQVCERVSLARSTFYRLRDAGELPYLEEVKPRTGKRARYRADLVEQYVANAFNGSPARKNAAAQLPPLGVDFETAHGALLTTPPAPHGTAGSRKAVPKKPKKVKKKKQRRNAPRAAVGTYAYESAPVKGLRKRKKG